jgi:hypothetical protein
VTSDATIASAAGIGVAKLASAEFARGLEQPRHVEERPQGLGGKLDDETRARLERLRRGE